MATTQNYRSASIEEARKLEPGAHHYRAYVGNPKVYDVTAATQFLLMVALGLREYHSLLDIGCGKGYFLKYLHTLGYKEIRGIDPCHELVIEKMFSAIEYVSFEKNNISENEFDFVFTCHTLHHLRNPMPISAIKEMARIAKK